MEKRTLARSILQAISVSAAMIGCALGFLVLAFEVYCYVVQTPAPPPLPPLFGNFPKVRETLTAQPPKEEFNFAVVGDIKSVGTFERIAEQLHGMPLDFAVLLGDCSYDGTEPDHRYFRSELAHEYAMPFPVFYVAGNHDVSEKGLPISRFEEVYGPTIFSFEYQDNLFIVLRILDEPFSNEESIEFLRRLVDERPEQYRRRFVFMHVPPPLFGGYYSRTYKESNELVALLEKLNVDYAFAGDFHGYARTTFGKTSYIVTGGGGGGLAQNLSQQFHHAVVVRVGKDFVVERIVPAWRSNDLEDVIERLAIADVGPWLDRNTVIVSLLNGVLVLVMAGLGWYLVRWVRACRATRACARARASTND